MPIDPGEVDDLRSAAADDPFGTVERMREDPELAVTFARADTLPFLQEWFTEIHPGWQADEERSGPLGRASVGVEWSFRGVHDKDSAFNGMPASQREVDVRGFSIFGVELERFQVRRYVDWAGLYAQLHLTVSWRIPLSNE